MDYPPFLEYEEKHKNIEKFWEYLGEWNVKNNQKTYPNVAKYPYLQKITIDNHIQPWVEQLDLVTRVMCDIMTQKENRKNITVSDEGKELLAAWNDFQSKIKRSKTDKEKKEELKKQALAKLTQEELDILGVKK